MPGDEESQLLVLPDLLRVRARRDASAVILTLTNSSDHELLVDSTIVAPGGMHELESEATVQVVDAGKAKVITLNVSAPAGTLIAQALVGSP